MAFKSARQRKAMMAKLNPSGHVPPHTRLPTGKKINFNFPLSPNCKVYCGINCNVGPYAGINYKPLNNLQINPRANLRYGPSANAQYRVHKNVKASVSVTPSNIDANIKAKIHRDTYLGIGIDKMGTYTEFKRRKSHLKIKI